MIKKALATFTLVCVIVLGSGSAASAGHCKGSLKCVHKTSASAQIGNAYGIPPR